MKHISYSCCCLFAPLLQNFVFRHHAVLQYGKPSEKDDVEFQKDGSGGFYLYDLGSTHSTYLNKSAVPSHKYYRVKVGHMMKFGGSSRLYILQVVV